MSAPAVRRSRAWPWALAALGYGAFTVIVTYPLAFHAATTLSAPPVDPLLNSWILWWDVTTLPLTSAWWNGPMFFPASGTMAFSETLVGLLPIAAPVQWLGGSPALAHNVAVLASFPLCALAAHALAYELTGRHDAAVLAGLAFGFSPYRGGEFGHVQVLSYYWAPIVLLALHRWLRTGRLVWVITASCAIVLQSLCNGYALFHLAVLVSLWAVWFCRRWRDWIAVAAVLAGAAGALAPVLLAYRSIHAALRLARSLTDILETSADIAGVVSLPREALILGGVLTTHQANGLFPGLTLAAGLAAGGLLLYRGRERRESGPHRLRRALLFCGLIALAAAVSIWIAGPWAIGPLTMSRPHKPLTIAIVAVALFSATTPALRRAWRTRSGFAFYALAALVLCILAFGPEPRLLGERVFYKAPYAWLMELPGFQQIRMPARFGQPALLCLAIAAPLLLEKVRSRWSVPRAVPMLLAAGIAADGLLRIPYVPLPPPGPPADWNDAVAVVELPIEADRDAAVLHRSIAYGRPVVNGTSGYFPAHYAALSSALSTGDVSVLQEIAGAGPIGIAIDRTAVEAPGLESALRRLPGVAERGSSRDWIWFVMDGRSPPQTATGPEYALDDLQAMPHGDLIGRAHDRRIDTAWSSDRQAGTEQITVRLPDVRPVSAVTLSLGACHFGFPRELSVETSIDGAGWTPAWRGSTAVATVRAALADPVIVPLTIEFAAAPARFVRLRQVAADSRVPWCVAEISIRRPN